MKKKVVLLGDGAVGKTSLIRKFVFDKFDDKYITTIGTKVTKKDIRVKPSPGETVDLTLMVWDILGQKGYHRIQKTGFQGTKGALLVCDMTRRETLESLEQYWLPNLVEAAGPVPVIFLGNKTDLIDPKGDRPSQPNHLTAGELRRTASKFSTPSYLTSAKTGLNVEDAFQCFGDALFLSKPDYSTLAGSEEQKEMAENPTMKLTDAIIQDFCKSYGNFDAAMPIIRRQFELGDVDIKEPTVRGLMAVIKRLANVEKGFRKPEEVKKNYRRRMSVLRRYKKEIRS